MTFGGDPSSPLTTGLVHFLIQDLTISTNCIYFNARYDMDFVNYSSVRSGIDRCAQLFRFFLFCFFPQHPQLLQTPRSFYFLLLPSLPAYSNLPVYSNFFSLSFVLKELILNWFSNINFYTKPTRLFQPTLLFWYPSIPNLRVTSKSFGFPLFKLLLYLQHKEIDIVSIRIYCITILKRVTLSLIFIRKSSLLDSF